MLLSCAQTSYDFLTHLNPALRSLLPSRYCDFSFVSLQFSPIMAHQLLARLLVFVLAFPLPNHASVEHEAYLHRRETNSTRPVSKQANSTVHGPPPPQIKAGAGGANSNFICPEVLGAAQLFCSVSVCGGEDPGNAGHCKNPLPGGSVCQCKPDIPKLPAFVWS